MESALEDREIKDVGKDRTPLVGLAVLLKSSVLARLVDSGHLGYRWGCWVVMRVEEGEMEVVADRSMSTPPSPFYPLVRLCCSDPLGPNFLDLGSTANVILRTRCRADGARRRKRTKRSATSAARPATQSVLGSSTWDWTSEFHQTYVNASTKGNVISFSSIVTRPEAGVSLVVEVAMPDR